MTNTNGHPTIMVSGGFDPIHAGHIRMIRAASEYGDVIVVLNSDDWLYRNKGLIFMEYTRRVEILDALKGVILVDSVDDRDNTVCEAIRRHRPTYFANGGNRSMSPEQKVCEELGVETLWGVGGAEDIDRFAKSVQKQKQQKLSLPPVRTKAPHSER